MKIVDEIIENIKMIYNTDYINAAIILYTENGQRFFLQVSKKIGKEIEISIPQKKKIYQSVNITYINIKDLPYSTLYEINNGLTEYKLGN